MSENVASQTLERIAGGRIIAIMRGDFGERASEIAAALHESGITAVEVTMNSPGAVKVIERLAVEFGDRLAIGAGTVLQIAEVERVAGAGARFIVSPNCERGVIAATKHKGLSSLPGCFTPSEIVRALDAGADAVKLFPARALGADFVRDVRAPLGDVRLVPTGGITPENAGEYLAAGAWALGVGSELIGKDVLGADGIAALRRRAADFMRAVRGGRHA